MKKSRELWEYIAVNIDGLLFLVQYPTQFQKETKDKYKYKLKCTVSISFHLGYNFFQDDNGTLCMVPI